MLSKGNCVATDFSRYYHDIILTHQSFVITTNFKLPFSPQEHSWFVLTNAVVSRDTCQKRRKANEVARSVSGKSSDSAKFSLHSTFKTSIPHSHFKSRFSVGVRGCW